MARTAVIAGVGPGLGESLARRFASEGCRVALFARSRDYIEALADDLPEPGDGLASRPTSRTSTKSGTGSTPSAKRSVQSTSS
jgi:NADP-dependent 3-hydroxy acid dehydrogenase YdfG